MQGKADVVQRTVRNGIKSRQQAEKKRNQSPLTQDVGETTEVRVIRIFEPHIPNG